MTSDPDVLHARPHDGDVQQRRVRRVHERVRARGGGPGLQRVRLPARVPAARRAARLLRHQHAPRNARPPARAGSLPSFENNYLHPDQPAPPAGEGGDRLLRAADAHRRHHAQLLRGRRRLGQRLDRSDAPRAQQHPGPVDRRRRSH